MQNSQLRLAPSSVVFREHLQERHCLWLPVYLPVRSEPVPVDVALWLFELRHFSDSNEVLCNSKVGSDCDSECDSCDLDAEELNKLGLQKNNEDRKEKCHYEVQDYPNSTGNCTLTGLLVQNEECLNIHSKVGEDQNCPSDVQEYPERSVPRGATPGLLNQKEISNENQSGDEETLTCCCLCLVNCSAKEDIPGLLILRENACVESNEEGEEAIKCHCQCLQKPTVEQDVPGLQQRKGGSIQTDKSDYDDASSLTVYDCIAQEAGIVNADEGSTHNQKVYEYQVVGESSDINQALKCHSILWEANPVYCRVAVEGSERGFRKLCHSTSERSGSSIHVGPGGESELGSTQINERVFTSIIDEHGVDCILNTDCVLCKQGIFSGKFPFNFCSQCGSLGGKTCMQTFRCDADLNTDAHPVGSNGNEAPSCIAYIQKAEVNGHSSGDTCQSQSDTDDQLHTCISNSDSGCDKAGDYYPTSEYFGDGNGVTASCGEKCDEVLHNLELLMQSLVIAVGDISGGHEIELDVDFVRLCHEAQNLADEAVQQCSVSVTSNMRKARSITLSSDLSDDVFINSTSSEEHSVIHPLPQEVCRHHSWDINSIFDDGIKPPVPPARLKKNKEKFKTALVSEHKITDDATRSVDVSECETMSQSNETKLLVRDVDEETNLLECQELLIMKRVTEHTKEKRNAKVTYHNKDRNLCCQHYEGHKCVPDCYATNVTIVVSHCSDSSVSDKGSESFESDDTVLRKPDSVRDEYPSIVLTQTRPISSAEYPPSEQSEYNLLCAYGGRLQTEEVSVETLCAESGSLLQNRKGSTSSDITAWKQELQHSGLYYLDDEWDADCMLQPDKWFSSNDSEGRVYFFEENSNESSWTLPDFSNAGCDNHAHSPNPKQTELRKGIKGSEKYEEYLDTDVQLRSGQPDCQSDGRVQHRMTKAHSMVLANSRKKQTSSKSSSMPRNWPQLWDGNMCVLKEGTLNRTKITENGKKLRKNWATAHVVLTELFLLFFKDVKTFEAMKSSGDSPSGAAQPEFSVDLNGAVLEHGEKASSRRNVFLLTTVLGLQVLLQCESAQQEEEWFKAINKAIKDLPSGYDASPKNKAAKPNPQPFSSNSPEETKKSSYIGRSRSVKLKLTSKDGSQEDLTASSEENQTKIRNRLKKFFHRRPTKDILVKKGIYKDEPVFGCHLPDVCKGESPKVPAFVQHCVAAIECKEENMKTDGLYRASGNLSQVQKIRLQVDQNNLEVLDQEEDVHVLTGALKLFFRELKKPLIPFEHFSKALRASTNPNKKEKLQHFREIVKALPVPNRDTLEFLLRHLLRVTNYKEFNRMHIPNLAIVFGPTLMWPEAESANMALDLMQQNLVIECFLQEFDSIFH